jgi:ribose transport system substrate-binding protein
LEGVSSGSPPATAGYAFKLMMEVLTKKRKLDTHNIEYPLPWVPANAVKLCSSDRFESGCNTFPAGKVPDSFVTEVFEPTLLPELSLVTALEGKPTPRRHDPAAACRRTRRTGHARHQLPALHGAG